MSKANLNV